MQVHIHALCQLQDIAEMCHEMSDVMSNVQHILLIRLHTDLGSETVHAVRVYREY